jgi:UDP-glucose 4-epimerase
VTVLVTGASGFIGSHLCRQLAKMTEVVGVDRRAPSPLVETLPSYTHRCLDLRFSSMLKAVFEKYRPSSVYHLAAQASVPASVRNPLIDAEDNIIATISLLFAISSSVEHIVYTSSGGACYGAAGEWMASVPETVVPAPLSPYGQSKLTAEWYVAHAPIPSTILRLANVYGPGQALSADTNVVAIFADLFERGFPATIDGDGSQVRDYVHVHDVVNALLLANAVSSAPINIGTGKGTSVVDLWRLFASLHPSHSPYRVSQPRVSDVRRIVLDVSVAERRMGWVPWIPLNEGVRSLVHHDDPRGGPLPQTSPYLRFP